MLSGLESLEVSQLMVAVMTGVFMGAILLIPTINARVRHLFEEKSLFLVEWQRRFSG